MELRYSKQNHSSSNIIVIGGTHHNTLGVIRALGERGYNVTLISISVKNYTAVSRYVNDVHYINLYF